MIGFRSRSGRSATSTADFLSDKWRGSGGRVVVEAGGEAGGGVEATPHWEKKFSTFHVAAHKTE